jgi:hypothetical protein
MLHDHHQYLHRSAHTDGRWRAGDAAARRPIPRPPLLPPCCTTTTTMTMKEAAGGGARSKKGGRLARVGVVRLPLRWVFVL